ncbi:hypothetical protein ACVIW2_007103 [Bradyrhizobium huanghuaihaiense]
MKGLQIAEHAGQAAEHASAGINWPIVFYICFGLLVLYVLHNLMGLSFTHFVKSILEEFRALLGAGPITRAKLNALLIVSLLCFVGFYSFVEPIRHLIELTGTLKEAEHERFYVELAGVFMIGVVGLLSVVSTSQ